MFAGMVGKLFDRAVLLHTHDDVAFYDLVEGVDLAAIGQPDDLDLGAVALAGIAMVAVVPQETVRG